MTASGDDTFALRVTVRGRVQGVGYRAWMQKEASKRGLKGWVRNRHDGSVEALVAGEKDNVTTFLDACKKGPLLSRVTDVASEPAPYDGADGFNISETA